MSGKYFTQDMLQTFIDRVHNNALAVVGNLRERSGISAARLFALLAMPGVSTVEISQRLMRPDNPPCGQDGYLGERIKDLLCRVGDGPDEGARRLLNRPLLVDAAIDISDWLLVVAPFADIRDRYTGAFLSAGQMLSQSVDGKPFASSGGQEILKNLLMTIDAATASYSLYYGDITARATLDALGLETTDQMNDSEKAKILDLRKRARILLSNNSFLAENVATLLLRDKYGSKSANGKRVNVNPVSKQGYETALEYAIANKQDRFYMLNLLFGEDLEFSADDKTGTIFLSVAWSDVGERIYAPLPTPEMFMAGRLSYPPQMSRLAEVKNRILERLLDYRFISGLKPEEQQDVAGLVARAEKGPSPRLAAAPFVRSR
jgi:hypothetical protein